jgi:hypothetical protein
VKNAAASIGMTSPSPGEVSYRDASADAVRLAARRLADGFGLGSLVDSSATATAVPTMPSTASTTTTATPASSTTATIPAAPTAAAPTAAAVPASGTSAPATTPSPPAAPVSTATAGGGVSPG